MKAAPFTRHSPRTLDEAVSLLNELQDEDCRIIAGGQSLVPMMAFRMARPAHLIDINSIEGLDGAVVSDDAIEIGPLVRHARFNRLAAPGPTPALLSRVMHYIAHFPIRTRGTFCGSLAHADPASEWCLVAVTLGASVRTRSQRGTRIIEADDFFEGLMTTSLEPDEMVVGARIPLLPADAKWGFYEFSRRPGDYAIAMALAWFTLKEGRIAQARIGIGGVEDRPRCIQAAQDLMIGQPPSRELFAAAADEAARRIEPMEDLQADEAYRRDLTRVVVCRALEALQ